MTAVAITVGVLSLLYLLVVQWSFRREMLTVPQYRARMCGTICLSILMALIIWRADLVPKPAELGSPVTAVARFGGYMLAMCVLLMVMLACALIDIRESLKAYIQAQRDLLRGHLNSQETKPGE